MRKLYATVLYGGLMLFLVAVGVISLFCNNRGYGDYSQWQIIFLMMFFFGLILIGCAFFYGKLWAIIGAILFYLSFTGLKGMIGDENYSESIFDFVANIMFYFSVFHIIMLFQGHSWKIKIWWLLSAILHLGGGILEVAIFVGWAWYLVIYFAGTVMASVAYGLCIKREFDYY